jgi:hypothetical protein
MIEIGSHYLATLIVTILVTVIVWGAGRVPCTVTVYTASAENTPDVHWITLEVAIVENCKVNPMKE